MAIPSLEMTAATARNNRCLAMPIECVGKAALIGGISIEHRDAAALATHEAEGIGAGARSNLLARRQTKSSIICNRRPLIRSARERRNIVLGIDRLPFGKHTSSELICFHLNALQKSFFFRRASCRPVVQSLQIFLSDEILKRLDRAIGWAKKFDVAIRKG